MADDTWKWSAPVFLVLGIGAPVYVWVRLSTGGVRGGSRRRRWGLLASGMWLSTGLALLAEAALGLLALIAVGVYFALHPGQVPLLQDFASRLSSGSGLSDVLGVLQPLLDRPAAFFAALVVFAGVAPLIEETAKSVSVWLVLAGHPLPGEGFVAGALTGAGFGLVEGLFASSNLGGAWGFTLAIRGGSALMHIAAAAAAGYGIAVFRRSGGVAPLVGGYFAAIAIHGTWNAAVVVLGFGGLHLAMGPNASNYLGLLAVVLGASILAALYLLTPFALILANRRLRSLATMPSTIAPDEASITAPAPQPPIGLGS